MRPFPQHFTRFDLLHRDRCLLLTLKTWTFTPTPIRTQTYTPLHRTARRTSSAHVIAKQQQPITAQSTDVNALGK